MGPNDTLLRSMSADHNGLTLYSTTDFISPQSRGISLYPDASSHELQSNPECSVSEWHPDLSESSEVVSHYAIHNGEHEEQVESDTQDVCYANGCIAMPIYTKPTTTYNNLGSPNDLPRSVAICPQRKCVAFGCRTGIELHWSDAATGVNLSRWFPLASPSDYLFFLPHRTGLDSAKKLRLVSSAAGPPRFARSRHNSVPTRIKFRPSDRRHGRVRSMTRLFFGDLPFPTPLVHQTSAPSTEESDRRGFLRTVDCDHYKAVPLSDGTHLMFIEPQTGLLCLGSDAPLGAPTKLVRKVCMVPPSINDTDTVNHVSCYKAGHDLRWGVRIVAAYDDGKIILYNIPSDLFERIRYVRSNPDQWNELGGVFRESDLLMDVIMSNSSLNNLETDGDNLISQSQNAFAYEPICFRSLQIEGAVIWETAQDVDDIHVDCSGGGFKVWIFHRTGQATKLDIYAPKNHIMTEQYVGIDGRIYTRGTRSDSADVKRHTRTEEKGKSREID